MSVRLRRFLAIRWLVLFAVCLGLLGGEAESTSRAAASFVTRSGPHFTLDGKPFYVTGTNNHYLVWATDQEVDNVLQDAAALHLNVIRTFISIVRGSLDGTSVPTIWDWEKVADSSNLGMNGVYFTYWDTDTKAMAFNDGPDGLQRVDHLIAKAQRLNIKLLFSLLDFWDYTGGSLQMDAWYGSTSRYQFFFSDPRTKQDYKNWVKHVLERVNTDTGVAYKDDPTIFGWDLMNEPQFKSVALAQGWSAEMAAYVKALDPNHLVAVGSEGFFGEQAGSDPYTELLIPSIDFGTWHIYPRYHNVTPAQVVGLINQHCDVARRADKPVLMEEFGYDSRKAEQPQVFRSWLDALAQNPNCAGWTFWRLTSKMEGGSYPRDNSDFFDVHNDGSPAATAFSADALAHQTGMAANALPTATAIPITQRFQRFVLGINFNGPAVRIGGSWWLDYKTALAQGLKVSGAITDQKALTPQPAVDVDTATMLSSLIYADTENGTIHLTQPLPNGSYQVYFWVMENFATNARAFSIRINGTQVSAHLGNLPMNGWAKYGPYPAQVKNGQLAIDLVSEQGRALLMGLAIYAQ